MAVVDQKLWAHVKKLFAAAIERDPAQRAVFLDEACGSDAALRREVESLLAAHEEGAPATASPTVHADQLAREPAHPPSEKPGTIIGPYKLLQQIGDGGFGAVYMAEQGQPVRRRVALKIIKAGMDTKQVIARFEAER